MRNAIAMMNTKGGVGKSTLVLGLAETLSAQFGKNVLVIDTDAQASVSLMLLTAGNLNKLQVDGLTIVDMLVSKVLKDEPVSWTQFAVSGVSDVEEARTVYLVPSDMQLTLFEREVAKEKQLARLRTSVGGLLTDMRSVFDVIFIDCPPGLSVLTECWLREADFYISPTKPDHICVYALEVFNHFKNLNPEMGICREPRRAHQHAGHAVQEPTPNSSSACWRTRKSLLPASRAAHQRAATRDPLQNDGTHVRQQVSRQIRRRAANLCVELLDRLDQANPASDRPASARPAAPAAR